MVKSFEPVMYMLTLLAFIHMVCSLEDDQIYCGNRITHLCLGKGQHVGCQFPMDGSGPNCQNYTKIQFNAELRHYITSFINKRRQRIAAGLEKVRGGKLVPKPKIMMQVEWDFELARLAQRLADQCNFVHDECRATLRYPYAGQTVGEVRWRHLSNSDQLSAQRGIRRVFDAWWGERRRVEPQQLVGPFRITDKGLDWGHFSQIAVWTLRAVGCGAVRHGEDYPRLLLVCDFSHTNMLGERTLNPGDLAPCPEKTRRRPQSSYPLLCAIIKEQVKNSKVIEDSDEPDYSDEDEFEHLEILSAKEDVKPAVTTKRPTITTTPKEEEDHWLNRLRPNAYQRHQPNAIHQHYQPAPSVEETTPHKVWSYRRDEAVDYEEYADFTSGKRSSTTTQKFRIKLKPVPDRSVVSSDEQLKNNNEPKKKILIDEDEYWRLSEQGKLLESPEDSSNLEPVMFAITRVPVPREYTHKPLRSRTFNIKTNTTLEPELQNPHHLIHTQIHKQRHGWKATRERPQRPGAVALLHPSPALPPVKMKLAVPTRISLRLDDDDAEQLWADTGFKPSWKTHNRTQAVVTSYEEKYM